MLIESVHSASYASEDQKFIFCMVKFEGQEDEQPFNACAEDVEAYGRDLYARLVKEEFGPVSAYAAPEQAVATPATAAMLTATVTKSVPDQLITALLADPEALSKLKAVLNGTP